MSFRRPRLQRRRPRAPPVLAPPREDWRELPLVTIDPPDARDHDDAVHAAPDPDPANAGGFILTVAIADVAAYVRPGSALDREALERGNSVYFPDRVVPMLPERISNDLCSLRPLEDRPALAVRMILGADGRKRSHRFHRVMMRSAAKLAYEQAQRAVDGTPDEAAAPLVESVLKPIYAAHAAIKIERERRDPLDLDLPERKLTLDGQGRLIDVRWPERLEAHRLIEEFMILANVAAAETLEAAHSPLIYRAHDAPSAEKLNDLVEFLASIGVKLAKGERVRPSHFNGVLSRVRGQAVEALVNEVVLRAQAQAEYSDENYGHFGLNLRRYAHFTSPIRRYADLIVHRALIRALGLGEGGLGDMRGGGLAQIAEHISAAERRAMAAERETVDRLVAAHLADRIGAVFSARIAGVTRVGLFLKLVETGADGFVPAATLGDDYFRFEEKTRALVGTRTRRAFRLGDAVEARLLEAAPFAGALRFEIVSGGGEGKGSGRKDARGSGRDAHGQSRPRRHAPMNDMSRFRNFPFPRPVRPLGEAIRRGILGRCPACGRGRMFRSYLKVVDSCSICGEDLSHQRADDAPAYVTMLIVGHLVAGGVLFSEEEWPHSSLVLVTMFWLTVTIVMSLIILPRAKGAVVGSAMGDGPARLRSRRGLSVAAPKSSALGRCARATRRRSSLSRARGARRGC